MRSLFKALAIAAGLSLAAPAAFAHAFLDHAVPGVGTTVTQAPGALELSFTQKLVAAFSHVQIAGPGGTAIPTGKPVVSGAVIHVPLAHPLKPGTYTVTWHVVSVDTHPTSGKYKFTVKP